MSTGEGLRPAPDDDVEVLEQTRRQARWPARRIALLLVAVVVLLGSLGVVDRNARGREQRALAGCEAAANATVDQAWAPVVAMAGYVRPTLSQVPEGRTRQEIFDLVAAEAEGGDQPVADAAARCASVPIWWHHADLRRQRDLCTSALAAEVGRLAAVARNGRAAFDRAALARCGPG